MQGTIGHVVLLRVLLHSIVCCQQAQHCADIIMVFRLLAWLVAVLDQHVLQLECILLGAGHCAGGGAGCFRQACDPLRFVRIGCERSFGVDASSRGM